MRRGSMSIGLANRQVSAIMIRGILDLTDQKVDLEKRFPKMLVPLLLRYDSEVEISKPP
jgi:hypothetical protein